MYRNNYFRALLILTFVCSFSSCVLAEEGSEQDKNVERKVSARQRVERRENLEKQAEELRVRAEQLARDGKDAEAKELMRRLEELRTKISNAATSKDDELLGLKLEEQELLERYGPDHPKVKALRKRVELLRENENVLFPQLLEEQMLLEKYGPHHPKVQSLRKRMELVREHLQQQELAQRTAAEPARSGEYNAEVNEQAQRIQHLREAAEHLAAAGLREQAAQIREQAEQLTPSNKKGPAVHAAQLEGLHHQVRELHERVERMEGILRRLVEQHEQNQKPSGPSPDSGS